MEPETNHYIPGNCNIGDIEIDNRKRIGWTSLTVTILGSSLMVFYHLAAIYRSFIFIPATLTAVYFIQAYSGFCVAYGWLGVFNFDRVLRKTTSVGKKEFKAKDRKKAIQLLFFSALIGITISLFVCFI